MAGSRIKGITIEINGDATGLNKALSDVNKTIKNTQSQLKDLDKVLKFNPGNTDLLVQKQKALGTEVDKTKEKLATEKEALKQLQEGAQNDETIRQQDNLQREIAETEQQLKDAEQAFKDFGTVGAQQTAAAGEKFQSFGSKLQNVGGTLYLYRLRVSGRRRLSPRLISNRHLPSFPPSRIRRTKPVYRLISLKRRSRTCRIKPECQRRISQRQLIRQYRPVREREMRCSLWRSRPSLRKPVLPMCQQQQIRLRPS